MPEVLMPKLGLTMTEGLLSKWLVTSGDAVSAGDLLFVVETDKVAHEIEAETDGVIEDVLVAEGETAEVGATLARLSGANGSSPAKDGPPPVVTQSDGDQYQIRPAKPQSGDRSIATPLARRIARQSGIDLKAVNGTGPRGRIKADDVRAAKAASAPSKRDVTQHADATRLKPDSSRLATARLVSFSKATVPHFYLTNEFDVGPLSRLRKELNTDDRRQRISITHMLLRAAALTLAENPAINRIWDNDEIVAFSQIDLGVVVETNGGVRIPILRDVANLSLDGIAATANHLVEQARSATLTAGDMEGGVMTISNVGMFGVSSLAPIINPPQAMILGVGAPRDVFRPDTSGAPVRKSEVTLTLACDHRIIDGALAARFLAQMVEGLSEPIGLLRPPAATHTMPGDVYA